LLPRAADRSGHELAGQYRHQEPLRHQFAVAVVLRQASFVGAGKEIEARIGSAVVDVELHNCDPADVRAQR
jgi:hypothetical protein